MNGLKVSIINRCHCTGLRDITEIQLHCNNHMKLISKQWNTIIFDDNCFIIVYRSFNKACTSHRPACAWFLRIFSVWISMCVCVFVCVCPPQRLLITSGMMWRDMVNKFYSCYRETIVIIVNRRGLGIGTHCRH